jgi:hypothetical protein
MNSVEYANRLILAILCLCLVIGVSCESNSPLAKQTDVSQTETPVKINPTPTMLPTPKELPATVELESQELLVLVPPGSEASIDGVLDAEEWGAALPVDLEGEGQLFLMHTGGYLYLGVRVKPEPVTSICVDQGEQVSILHSSAALGSAIYQRGDETWKQIKEFEWCCRETTDSPQAQGARQAQLLQDGWVASNGRMGNSEEVEYQIAFPGDTLRLSVNSIGAPDYETVTSWPADLSDDCSGLEMLTGPVPEQAVFSPDQWISLTLSPE